MSDTVLTDLKIYDFDSLAQMSQYESEIGENDIVFTPDISCRLPLLTPMFFDHITNDMSWLRADTFSWQSGDVYKAAYEHLADDYNSSLGEGISGIVSGLPNGSDTIGDITILYYLAQDGHKICLPDQESNIVALYEATGVAWYYILDTVNKQFKLPRTKWGFTGLRDGVGAMAYTAALASMPDYSTSVSIASGWVAEYDCIGYCTCYQGEDISAVVYVDGKVVYQWQSGNYPKVDSAQFVIPKGSTVTYSGSFATSPKVYKLEPNAPATQMYLYFYVGNFEQSAIEQTAGITAETLNGKADVDLGNIPANYDYVVESQLPTAENGYTWYRKYKSGWVEQGGLTTIPSAKYIDITLPIPMQDNHYSPMITASWSSSATGQNEGCDSAYKTNTTMRLAASYANVIVWWQVSGMAA